MKLLQVFEVISPAVKQTDHHLVTRSGDQDQKMIFLDVDEKMSDIRRLSTGFTCDLLVLVWRGLIFALEPHLREADPAGKTRETSWSEAATSVICASSTIQVGELSGLFHSPFVFDPFLCMADLNCKATDQP